MRTVCENASVWGLPLEMLLEKTAVCGDIKVQDRQIQTFAVESWMAYEFQIRHGNYYTNEFLRDMDKIPSLKRKA